MKIIIKHEGGPKKTCKVIEFDKKKLRHHNLSIHRKFHPNLFIHECATKNLCKIKDISY